MLKKTQNTSPFHQATCSHENGRSNLPLELIQDHEVPSQQRPGMVLSWLGWVASGSASIHLCKGPCQPLRWKSWASRPDSWMRSWHLLLLAMRSPPNSQGSKQSENVGSFVQKALRVSRQRGQSTAPSLDYLWGSCVLQHRDFSTSAPCLHPRNSPWSVCITGLWESGQWRQLSFTKLEHATVSMLSFLPALCLISTRCPPNMSHVRCRNYLWSLSDGLTISSSLVFSDSRTGTQFFLYPALLFITCPALEKSWFTRKSYLKFLALMLFFVF